MNKEMKLLLKICVFLSLIQMIEIFINFYNSLYYFYSKQNVTNKKDMFL